MKPLSTILLLSFIGLSVFGIFGMHTGMEHHNNNCVAATAQSGNCPRPENLFEFLSFHLEAVKDFSTAVFTGVLSSTVILSLALIGIAFLWYFSCVKLSIPSFSITQQFQEYPQHSFTQFLRWLSLHENSPTPLQAFA